jgi:hypothetical protein
MVCATFYFFCAKKIATSGTGPGGVFDHEDVFHHISVPCIRPSTMLIAIAEMNTPASMYVKSM